MASSADTGRDPHALDTVWSAFAAAPVAVAIVGADGQLLRANRAFCDILGRDVASALSMRVCQLIHPDDLAGTTGVDEPLPSGRRELRWLRQDGTARWCETSVWAVDGDGDPQYWVHQLDDVTEQRELGQRLSETRDQFRMIIEAIADYAVFLMDADGRVSTWNLGAERIKGYTADEIIGQPYSRFFTPDDAAAGAPESNLAWARAVGSASGEGWRVRKDGTRFWAAWWLYRLVRDDTVVGFAKITRDMTEQRAAALSLAEERSRLEATNQQLKLANEFRDDLLAVAHHEFRTPLTALIGFSKTLLTAWDRLSGDERTEAFEAIHTASRRLSGLVDNLIALSALSSISRGIEIETVRLSAAVVDAAAMADTALDEMAIAVPDSLAAAADPVRLRQLLANLLSNASIYGGGACEIVARRDGSMVRIEVADRGPGVPPEFVPRLFKRFTQASRGDLRTSQGTGLGLATVKELAEAQGGRVEYQPNEPTGARFVVHLRAA